ncbi:DUF5753 domain-containing protein [Streptomyces sioyaensis]|uniref:DUF5753 domain-containing protein n=1 Tax=Streptomyces sioyaensis TaxID=67364 RepID=UPI0033E1E32D
MSQSASPGSTYVEWRHQLRDGLKPLQESLDPLFHETQLFRIYSSTLMPGLLQTEGYAAAVLRRVADFPGLPFDDSAEAARARVERSKILHQPGHEFELLVEESVLYHQIPEPEAMGAQLENLATASALPAVSLGIIPLDTRERAQVPQETFHVYDDTLVSVELISAEVKITQPSEIALYLQMFEQLRSMAVYGAEARALILKALDALR